MHAGAARFLSDRPSETLPALHPSPPAQELFDKTQQFVEGTVRVKLYKVRGGGCGGGWWWVEGTLQPMLQQRLHKVCSSVVVGWLCTLQGAPLLQSAPLPTLTNPCAGTPHSATQTRFQQGNVIVCGRKSRYSLYDSKISSFEDDEGAYDQKDAAGFIKLQVGWQMRVPIGWLAWVVD